MNYFEHSDIPRLLRDCFASDQALIDRWHIAAGSGLEGCVARTLSDLKSADESFKFFRIENEGQIIGFFGSEYRRYLTTLFIFPEHRVKETVQAAWDTICSHFEGDFYAAVYSRNHPCISFYAKNGRMIDEFDHSGERAVCFKFER